MSLSTPIIRELIDDLGAKRQFNAIRVYSYLEKTFALIYFEPQAVKLWLVAEALGTNRTRAQQALELLIAGGYATEHGRDSNGVRKLMLARQRIPEAERCTKTVQHKVTA